MRTSPSIVPDTGDERHPGLRPVQLPLPLRGA
jgi:hypothetical protein